MIVKEAEQEDIDRIIKFILKAWSETGPEALGWRGASEENIAQIASYEFLKGLIDNEGVKIFISLDGDEVVGFSSNRRISDDIVELSGIVVLESRTGTGVGSALIERSVCEAGDDGFHKMTVKTESYNERAIGFYMSKGFKVDKIVEEKIEGEKIELLTLNLSI